MKKTLLILAAAICTLMANAQEKFNPEKFRAELHKYIITEAHLSPAEAGKFFPLYDEMKSKQRELHKKMKPLKKKPATEAACRKAILSIDNYEIKIKQIERTYHTKFLKIMPASKLHDVLRAEAKFHAKVFKKAAGKGEKKERHRK